MSVTVTVGDHGIPMYDRPLAALEHRLPPSRFVISLCGGRSCLIQGATWLVRIELTVTPLAHHGQRLLADGIVRRATLSCRPLVRADLSGRVRLPSGACETWTVGPEAEAMAARAYALNLAWMMS